MISLGFSTSGSFRQLPSEKLEELFLKVTEKVRSLHHPTNDAQQQLKSFIEEDLRQNYNMNLEDFEFLWGHQLYITAIHKFCIELCDSLPFVFEGDIASEPISIVDTLQTKNLPQKILDLAELIKTAKKYCEDSVHASWKDHKIKEVNIEVSGDFLIISCCYCEVIVKACDQKISNFSRHLTTVHGKERNENKKSKRPRNEQTSPALTIPNPQTDTNLQTNTAMSITPETNDEPIFITPEQQQNQVGIYCLILRSLREDFFNAEPSKKKSHKSK